MSWSSLLKTGKYLMIWQSMSLSDKTRRSWTTKTTKKFLKISVSTEQIKSVFSWSVLEKTASWGAPFSGSDFIKWLNISWTVIWWNEELWRQYTVALILAALELHWKRSMVACRAPYEDTFMAVEFFSQAIPIALVLSTKYSLKIAATLVSSDWPTFFSKRGMQAPPWIFSKKVALQFSRVACFHWLHLDPVDYEKVSCSELSNLMQKFLCYSTSHLSYIFEPICCSCAFHICFSKQRE